MANQFEKNRVSRGEVKGGVEGKKEWECQWLLNKWETLEEGNFLPRFDYTYMGMSLKGVFRSTFLLRIMSKIWPVLCRYLVRGRKQERGMAKESLKLVSNVHLKDACVSSLVNKQKTIQGAHRVGLHPGPSCLWFISTQLAAPPEERGQPSPTNNWIKHDQPNCSVSANKGHLILSDWKVIYFTCSIFRKKENNKKN